MPNYNKSFNFRNGVQVDEDDLIVRSSLVGIGTTIPRSELDVRGDIKSTGVVTSTNLFITGIATFNQVAIGTGIEFFGNTGIISATFFGDGSNLDNVPTSQWVDIDVGAGVTSIYSKGNVGVATTNPSFVFQVAGSPDSSVEVGVGINSLGDIKASGIITASSFVGSGAGLTSLNASNFTTGTIPTARLPQDFSLTGLDLQELFVTGITTLSETNIHSLSVTNTTASGVSTFNDNVSIASSILFGDNNKAMFGADDDLQIYHDGSNSFIDDGGTGGLFIRAANQIGFRDAANSFANFANFVSGGTVDLYYNGNKKFETTGYGVTVTGITSTTNLTVGETSEFVGQINADGNIKLPGVADNQVLTSTATGTIDSSSNLTFDGSSLKVTGVTTTSDLYVTGVGTVTTLSATSASSGVIDVDNVRIDGNTVETSSGSLTLDSNQGSTTINSDLVIVGVATVNQSLLSDTDQGADLGSSTKRFGAAHIDNITIGVDDANTIASISGNLTLKAPGASVSIANFSPVGVVTFTGNILPDADKTLDLGSASNAYRELYVGDLKLSNSTLESDSGSLTLTGATGIVTTGGDFEVTGESRFNSDVYIGGIDFYVDTVNNRIGIGTTGSLTNALTVFGDGVTITEVVGTTAQLALGESLGVGNDSGTIAFTNKELSIENRDEGDINITLNAGTGINTTGAFKVVHAGDSIISAGYSGVVGINKGDPAVALDVNGDLDVSGYGRVVGVLTIGQGAEQVTFGTANAQINGTLIGNVVSNAGFSTFQDVIVNNNLSLGIGSFAVGVGSFNNATFGNNSNQFDGETVTIHGNQQMTGSLFMRNTSSAISLGSTALASDDRPLVSADNLPAINYGQLQVFGDMAVIKDGGGSVIFVASDNDDSVKPAVASNSNVADGNPDYMMKVGINTFVARCSLDMGSSTDYFLPPVHNETTKQFFIDNPGLQTVMEIGGSTGKVMPGALIYNEDTERLEVGIGTTGIFCGVVTTTYNKTGLDAISIPVMTTANRNTTTNAGGIHAGALIYNTTETRLEVYSGSSWSAVGGGAGSYVDSDVDQHLNQGTAASGEVLSWNGSDYDWIAQSGGSGGTGFFEQNSSGINTVSSVGIGSTLPTAKLDVNGDFNVSGIVTVGAGTSLTSVNTPAMTLAFNNPTLATTIGTEGQIKQIGGVPFYFDGVTWREFVLSTGTPVTQTADTDWDNVMFRFDFEQANIGSLVNLKDNTSPTNVVVNIDLVNSPVRIGTKSVRYQQGHSGIAYDQDPLGTTNPQYDFEGAWTIEGYINLTELPANAQNSSDDSYAIVSQEGGGGTSTNDWVFGLRWNETGTAGFAGINDLYDFYWYNENHSDSGNDGDPGLLNRPFVLGTVNGAFLQNQWIHVALVRDALDGSIRFYLNGQVSNTTGAGQLVDNEINNTDSKNITFGHYANGNDQRRFRGLFDDFRVSTIRRYTGNAFTPATTALPITGTTSSVYVPPRSAIGEIALGGSPTWTGTGGYSVTQQASGYYRLTFASSFSSTSDYIVNVNSMDHTPGTSLVGIGVSRASNKVDFIVSEVNGGAAVDTGSLAVQVIVL